MSQKAHEGAVPIWPGPRWLRSHIPRSPQASGGEIMSVCSQPGVSWGATSPGARGGSCPPPAPHPLLHPICSPASPCRGFRCPSFYPLQGEGHQELGNTSGKLENLPFSLLALPFSIKMLSLSRAFPTPVLPAAPHPQSPFGMRQPEGIFAGDKSNVYAKRGSSGHHLVNRMLKNQKKEKNC